MNNKTKKILMITILLIIASLLITHNVYADAYTGWNTYNPSAKDNSGASASVGNMANAILSIVQVVAMGTAVVMLIVLGIKYISASPGDKAEIKKHAVVYVVGAVILFGATGIIGIIRSFATSNITPPT